MNILEKIDNNQFKEFYNVLENNFFTRSPVCLAKGKTIKQYTVYLVKSDSLGGRVSDLADCPT